MIYDSIAPAYAEKYADEVSRKLMDREKLTSLAEMVRGKGPVADLGCGPGFTTAYLHRLDVAVTGYDLSPGLIREARRLHPNVAFDVADMLGVDPFRVTVERSTNVITQLACVQDLLHRLAVSVKTHRTLRINDAIVPVDANTADYVVQRVMDELPSRNDFVDQPLRCFWIVGIQSSSGAGTSMTHGVLGRTLPKLLA